MRERTTWQTKGNETPRQAATSRRADVYTMNQEHPQPSPVDYETGSPDAWAETPVSGDKMSVNGEYEGGHVKRNEIGLGEFRDDTFKHKDSEQWGGSGKYDNAKVAAERKAIACEKLARAILRTADDKLVEATALDLMSLPDKNLVATIRRLDQASPAGLPQDARLRRALACTKLAKRTLGDKATDAHVESLASAYMSVDDATLKTMLKVVAAVHVAEQQEEQQEEQQGGKTSQQQEVTSQEQQEQQEVTSQQVQQGQQQEVTSQQVQQGQQGQQQEQQEEEQQQQEACLPAGDMALLDQMLQQEMAEHAAPAAGGDSLSALFQPAAAPAAPVPAAPMLASEEAAGISFDDEEAEGRTASSDVNVDDLFADDPEVQAQRQIKAAEQEQSVRAGGFQSVGRTASANGVKKVGQVRKAPPVSVDKALEGLWDRP